MDLISELMKLQRMREPIGTLLDNIDEGIIEIPLKVSDVLMSVESILENLFE